jgi:hypothetical protein
MPDSPSTRAFSLALRLVIGARPMRALAASSRISRQTSRAINYLLAFHTLMAGHSAENRIERSDPERRMRRYSDSMNGWIGGLEYDMAPLLMNSVVSPSPAKAFSQFRATQIAWCLHTGASTSSRTRCKRTRSGMPPSKK